MKTRAFAVVLGAVLMAGVCAAVEDLAAFVDPFIGTAATGHTTPAACVPFGLVQAGPDTGRGGWDHCSGYIWTDKTVCGFSQTHLNGTGCSDLGDLPILPFRGDRPEPQVLDKSTETAAPGYYAVTLKDARVRAEMTARPHVGFYRFTYLGDGARRLLVDCQSAVGGNPQRQITRAEVALNADKRGVSGRLSRSCWVSRTYSFALVFDRPYTKVVELPRGKDEKAPRYVFDFDLKPGETLQVKVALSAEGDVAAAEKNLATEAKDWNFDAVRQYARLQWNALLARVAVDGDTAAKTSFYTSVYHLFMQPNNLADVGAKPFFSTLSCWDTFRAAHPLYTLLAPDAVPGLVDTMLEQGRRTGYLPIWTLWGKDNQCMIGTHSIPVIIDAAFKGLLPKGADLTAIYEQIKETLTKPHPGRRKENWDLLDKYGYYPCDLVKRESVSRTFECAYDDWCAAQLAAKLGRTEDAAFFTKRSNYWKNVFDAKQGFARGKDSKGRWRTPYSPYKLGNDFTEGNAFQYSWHVMQDPEGLVALMGGREAFIKKLDTLFTAPEKVKDAGNIVDVTGLIGQYAHGNEPSHHVVYFYSLVGRRDRTAERVREVFDRFYLPKPDGLCGNDDCGQMSAWYVFSAMGFYPFNPCGGEYVLGAPQLPRVRLSLPGGKRFSVFAINLSEKNKYVKSVMLNGKPYTDPILRHADIIKGGELVFTMTDKPEAGK
ncbi:MAG: GH92 family glycosyl hydrolase [Kiritimatiellae bacterium]|nr:GH92 family glycosyl hydrolase [Kiritimatiellia bacterium]